MDEPLKKCPVCRGLGYFRCACWPADCLCGADDEECDVCDGTGRIYPEDYEGLYENEPHTKETD